MSREDREIICNTGINRCDACQRYAQIYSVSLSKAALVTHGTNVTPVYALKQLEDPSERCDSIDPLNGYQCGLEQGHMALHYSVLHNVTWAGDTTITDTMKENTMYDEENATIKTYRVSKLLAIVRNWNNTVEKLEGTLDTYNADRQQIVAERMASYIAHGTYQDDDGNTVDHSTSDLSSRICVLSLDGCDGEHPGFEAREVTHRFNTFSELQLQLETLADKTVDMTNDEVERIFQLADTARVAEMIAKYS